MPLPLPLLPVVSQLALLAADQVQPEDVVTLNVPEEPPDPNEALVGESEYVQDVVPGFRYCDMKL